MVVSWLEEITQAPGGATAGPGAKDRYPLRAPTPGILAIAARLSVEVAWTGGIRWGRTQMGKAMMTAVKTARVTAIAGRVRRP
jgi:hypothetical protein